MNIVTNEMIDFKNQIKRGEIIPTRNSVAHIEMKENSISICFQDLDFKEDDLVSVFFYDKKTEKILAFAETSSENSTVIAKISDVAIDALVKSDFKYARVCIAIKSGKKSVCSYISETEEYIANNNKPDYSLCLLENSTDSSRNVLVYFSAAGLLSIKSNGYDKSNLLSRVLKNMTIKSVSYKEGSVVIEREYIGNDFLFRSAKLVFVCDGGALEFEETSAEYDEENNVTRIIYEFPLENIDLYGKMTLSYSFGGETTGINLDNRIVSGFNYNRDFKIKSKNKDRIVVFNLEFGQLIMIVCRKFYNSVIAVIMAVYNTEHFVAEAIESILEQKTDKIKSEVEKKYKEEPDVYYKNLYELILVDDGSEDESGSICDKYADSYPQITVIHKENGGVSSARNMGIKASNAKYLNFMDSDDKFSENVFEECFSFFEKHYDEISLVTFPLKFFDAKSGDHWLNYKFTKDRRIANLENEPASAVTSTCSSFFKSEDIYDKMSFDETVANGEDIKFIYSLFVSGVSVIGLTKMCTYWYRRRSIGEKSAVQNSLINPLDYTPRIKNFMMSLINMGEDLSTEKSRYLQTVVMQQLQFKLTNDGNAEIAKTVLSEEEFAEYKQAVFDLFGMIDTDIILSMKHIYREHKYYILSHKSNCTVTKEFTKDDVMYAADGINICTASTATAFFDFCEITSNSIIFEGYFTTFENKGKFYYKIGDELTLIEEDTENKRDKNVYVLGDKSLFAYNFKIEIDLDRENANSISFWEEIDGVLIRRNKFKFTKYMPIVNQYSKSYYLDKGWLLRAENNCLVVRNMLNSVKSLTEIDKFEKEYIEQVENTVQKTNTAALETIEFRKKVIPLVNRIKTFSDRKILLICDRTTMAGDNGEALFMYLNQIKDDSIDVYYVIDKNSEDYERLKKTGKVLALNSFEHKVLNFAADFIISSMSEEYIINPFSIYGTTDIIRDLVFKSKFIFLQHGITKDDVSGLFGRYVKNITGFVTAAYNEKQSILDYDYFYPEENVWLTGFPRYDRLYSDEKRIITIMPTWRKKLVRHPDNDPFLLTVIEEFKDTSYFEFYNSLMNDERLLSAAEKYNFTISYMPHPNLRDGSVMFDHDSRVVFYDGKKTYRELFAESNLMITDYSSTVMDFAYLRKPVVYTHFDKEEFFENHTYSEGYFDYERDGFGEVTYDLDSLVDTIIEYMENECRLKDMYKERIDKFFAFNDKNNCERVYKKIKELF